MRRFFTLALFAAALGAVSMGMGCSSKKGNTTSNTSNGGEGGAGGAGGAAGSAGAGNVLTTTGPGMPTTSSGTMPLDCSGTLQPNECTACAEKQCCQEIINCQDDAECNDCISNQMADPAVCQANAQLGALNDCAGNLCQMECAAPKGQCARYCCDDTDCGTGKCQVGVFMDFPKIGLCLDATMMAAACDAPAMSATKGACFTIDATNVCNPVTNEGCTMAGSACDLNQNGNFVCFPDGNTEAICAECSNSDGPFCQPTFHCTQ